MKSIFKTEQREEAISVIVEALCLAARNCGIVTQNLFYVSKDPQRIVSSTELINDYRSFVFTYPIATLSQNGSSDTPFSESERESITNSYFLYLASLLPFYYEAEKITYEGIGQKKSYKWSKEDFKLLVRLLLQKWYYMDWDNFSFEERLKNGLTIENRTATALSLIKNSSKLKSSFFNSQEKCDKVIYPSTLNEQVIEEMNLQCFSESQLILLRSYLSDFIKGIPGSLIRFNDSFYESGSFLKKYFSWS